MCCSGSKCWEWCSVSAPPSHILGIVSHGLAGAMVELPEAPLAGDAWSRLLAEVTRRRIIGHLLHAAEDGAFPTTSQQFDEVCMAHRRAMAAVLHVERSLLQVVTMLEEDSIDYRVLKGAALAHTCYEDPSDRVYGDVDLLVPSDGMEAVVRRLRAGGYRRLFPQLREGFDRRFSKAVTLEGASGLQIDLHRTFLMGPYGLLVDTAGLFERCQQILIGEQAVRVLELEAQVLHAAYAVALGDDPPKASALRDLAQLILRRDPASDRLLDLASRSHGLGVLAAGIATTWRALRIADALPLSVWAQRYEPSRREQRLMRSYTGEQTYAAKAYDSVRVLPSFRERAAYLQAVALPRQSFLDLQEVSTAGWIHRGSKALFSRGIR
jgi:hypothetical protein